MTDSSVAGAARNLDAAGWLIEQAESATEHIHAQVLVTSATFWLTTVHDILAMRLGEPERQQFFTAVDATEGGATLRALRLARNEAAHGTTLIVANQGLVFPMFADGFADFGGGWVKTEFLRTAAAEPGRRPVKVETFEAYEAQVAGRPPTFPVRVAYEFLKGHMPTP